MSSVKKDRCSVCLCAEKANKSKDDQSAGVDKREKYFVENKVKSNKTAVASDKKNNDVKSTSGVKTKKKKRKPKKRFSLGDSYKIKMFIKKAKGYEIDALNNVSYRWVFLSILVHCQIFNRHRSAMTAWAAGRRCVNLRVLNLMLIPKSIRDD